MFWKRNKKKNGKTEIIGIDKEQLMYQMSKEVNRRIEKNKKLPGKPLYDIHIISIDGVGPCAITGDVASIVVGLKTLIEACLESGIPHELVEEAFQIAMQKKATDEEESEE